MAASLLQRFQGALVGAVIGDCIGGVYEGDWGSFIGMGKVLQLVNKIKTAHDDSPGEADSPSKKSGKKLMYAFTDDTAMARSVARSLIVKKDLDSRDMARRFTEEFFKEPNRGYGSSIGTVFKLLSESNYEDPFDPAKKQFDGIGSYGNGGAMRISPAALFANKRSYDFSKLKELTETITRITHSHAQAIQGAVLQCYAVELALRTEKLDTDEFVDDLIDKMKPLEEERLREQTDIKTEKTEEGAKGDMNNYDKEKSDVDSKYNKEKMPYCWKLEKIREYVKSEQVPSTEEIGENLGTDVSALGSVPAAIYSFLISPKHVDELKDRSGYERTIITAISLGGDTDTIATMAGAIAGAYYGLDDIQLYLQEACEGVQDALEFAKDLYNLTDLT